MKLEEIYRPIAGDLKTVEDSLSLAVKESKNRSILAISNSLLESPGKRIRPALVLLSGKAASMSKSGSCNRDELIKIATAIELIHMASLIHDDAIDEATIRHSKPTINAKWGDDVSISLGDYIYSKAFQLIGKCKNPDIFACISEAIYVMCEGELLQVCQRNNLDLSKDNYIVIIKKKTASLFAACCHVGSIMGNHDLNAQIALREFGLDFGIAFQIMDDCKDITSDEEVLGKWPGQDVIVGDMTLPLLTLLDAISTDGREKLKNMLESKMSETNLERIRSMLVDSDALFKTQEVVSSYINCAKERLKALADSDYKESLSQLADYITQRTFLNFVR